MASYGTTDQLIVRINLRTAPTVAQLVMLGELIEAASRAIDSACRRPVDAFAAAGGASAMYYTAEGLPYLRITPCQSITSVAVKASLTATTYTAWTTPTTPLAGDGDWIPCAGNAESPTFGILPYTLLLIDVNGDYAVFLDGGATPVVMVTATWGTETAVPAEIRELTLMQTALWLKSFQGSGSDTLGSLNFGQIRIKRALSKTVRDGLEDGAWLLPLYGGA